VLEKKPKRIHNNEEINAGIVFVVFVLHQNKKSGSSIPSANASDLHNPAQTPSNQVFPTTGRLSPEYARTVHTTPRLPCWLKENGGRLSLLGLLKYCVVPTISLRVNDRARSAKLSTAYRDGSLKAHAVNPLWFCSGVGSRRSDIWICYATPTLTLLERYRMSSRNKTNDHAATAANPITIIASSRPEHQVAATIRPPSNPVP
jgi:hypothetical protein